MGQYMPFTKGVGFTGKSRQYEVRWNLRLKREADETMPERDKLIYVNSLHVESAIAAAKREIIKDPDNDITDKDDIVILNVILSTDSALDVYNEGL